MRPFFSIIIATYNSANTIKYTLDSIRTQTMCKEEIEVLVIDGGSTDGTVEIAKNYNVRLLKNPDKLPEYAKTIGVREAKGQYIIRMDSDEEFVDEKQLEWKKTFLLKNPNIKVLISNRYVSGRKEICGISADYMNILGDPFSYYVYRTKKDKYETYKNNIVATNNNEVIMKFASSDIYPLADSATCLMSLDYIKNAYPNNYDTIDFTCSAYDKIISDTKYCGCIIGDDIKHNCKSDFRTYLRKLEFRVINNVFQKKESGFSSKESYNKKLRVRKVSFCLYALLVPVTVIDSIRLVLVYKNVSFLLHFVYLYYVCILIVKYYGIKLLGGVRKNKKYGI